MTWIEYRINDLRYTVNRWRIRRKHSRKPISQELWSLDVTFAEIISNYIEHFRENRHGFPALFSSEEEWDDILSKIQRGFETYAAAPLYIEEGSEEDRAIKEALHLFSKYFKAMWD